MRAITLSIFALVIALATSCQASRFAGNTDGSRRPIGPPLTIAEQSRAIQGGSFGRR